MSVGQKPRHTAWALDYPTGILSQASVRPPRLTRLLRPAAGGADLAANLTARVGHRMDIGIGQALLHRLEQLGEVARVELLRWEGQDIGGRNRARHRTVGRGAVRPAAPPTEKDRHCPRNIPLADVDV